MSTKPINQVVAEALRYFMGTKWTNVDLARASGVAEGTIRNFLAPEKRVSGKAGKEPSGKIAELALLAAALGVQVADLVTDATADERAAIHRDRAADYYRKHGKLPSWAPVDAIGQAAERDQAMPVAGPRKRAAQGA